MNLEKIKKLRKEQGLSQSKVADLLGVGLRSYQYKEAGDIKFDIDEVKILLKLFNTTFEQLMI